jgi:hypothetical protein
MLTRLLFVGSYALHSSFGWPLKLALIAQTILTYAIYLVLKSFYPESKKASTIYPCIISSWFISHILLLFASSLPAL